MAGHRITKVEKNARVNVVYQWLINGMPTREIYSNAAKKHPDWNVNPRQIDAYIADARTLLEADAEYIRSEELGKAINRLNGLYAASRQVQDHARALAVTRELSKLLGLYAAPAPQTFLFGELDPALMATLTDALQRRGISPSDAFQAMLSELAESEVNHE